MRRRWLCWLLLLPAMALAQAPPPPAAPPAEDRSGMYEFLHDGEFVQITIEDARLSGFVSRLDDEGKGPVLDHFFDKTSLEGNRLAFTTKVVHGVWFDFKGTIERGEGKTRADEGYYLLRGTLTVNTSDAGHKVTARSREVAFKSFPRLDEDAPPKR